MIDTSVILRMTDALQENVIAKTELDSIKLALTKLIELKEQEIVKIDNEILENHCNNISSVFTSYKIDQLNEQIISLKIKNRENNDSLAVINDNIQTIVIRLTYYLNNHFINN